VHAGSQTNDTANDCSAACGRLQINSLGSYNDSGLDTHGLPGTLRRSQTCKQQRSCHYSQRDHQFVDSNVHFLKFLSKF
jgi:hypothetical protein